MWEISLVDERTQKLRNKALRLLAQREHSQAELIAKLERAGDSRPRRGARAAERNRCTTDSAPRVHEQTLQTGTAHSPDDGFVPTAQTEWEGVGTQARATAAQIVAALRESGYQSDQRYAEGVVRRLGGHTSLRSVKAVLERAGVDKSTIDAALAERTQSDDEVALALWQKKFGRKPQDDKEKARQIRFLQSRGFSLSVAFKVLRTVGVRADEA